jgi:PBSX family phage portal protein
MVTQETGESFSKMQENSQQFITGVRIDKVSDNEDFSLTPDEFSKSLDEYLKLGGLSHNFRRQAQRKLKKADNNELSGDASGSTQIIPDKYGYGLFDVVEPPYNIVSLAKIYEVSPANYAAINAKAANIVGLGYTLEPSLNVVQRLEDITDTTQLSRARKKIERSKQELQDWIESRNDEETLTSILTKVFIDLEATGNGYIEIGRKNTGEIGYIGHVPCQNLRVRRLRDGFVQIQQGKAVFFRNFQDVNQPNPIGVDQRPNEIIHLKNYTPTNTYYGIPAAVPAKNAIAGQEFASRYNLEYFENKAVPRYMVVLKGAKLSREAESAIFEFFQNKLKGQSHRTVIVPLPADDAAGGKVEMKLEAIENGIQDSSFNNYRKSTLEDILMAHRVPVSKVATASNVSIAAAKEFDRTFKEQVCRPMQDTLEKKINRIVAEKTDAFKLKFNELTLTDEDTQSKIDERYLRMKVVMPNEIRPRLGLPQIDGGDEPVQLTGQQAADQTANATGNRLRDQQREANAGDSNTGARNAQGDGRQQA